jgi:hypothetical protein
MKFTEQEKKEVEKSFIAGAKWIIKEIRENAGVGGFRRGFDIAVYRQEQLIEFLETGKSQMYNKI